MKKLIRFSLLIFTVVIVLSGCFNKNASSGYIKEISFDEFMEKVENKESFPVYIGNEGCSFCVAYKPTLESVAKDYNITIYHVDNSKLTEDEAIEFSKYINYSGTPTVAFITDGDEETTLNRITGKVSLESTIARFKTNGYINE